MRRSIIGAVLLLGQASCHHGQRTDQFAPARTGSGAIANLETAGGNLKGELLTVADSGVFVLKSSRVTFIAFGSFSSLWLDELGASYLADGKRRPDPLLFRRLQLVSRYPQGVNAPLLDSLLRTYGQREVDAIR